MRRASTLSAASFAAAFMQRRCVPRCFRRHLGHAAFSSANSPASKLTLEDIAELKSERPLRIKARMATGKRKDSDGIIVHFQRHGQGTHNALYKKHADQMKELPDLSSNDRDKNPLLCESVIDAPLTEKGVEQCLNQQHAASKLKDVELIVVSPLLRAMQTADITFDKFKTRKDVKWILNEDVREELGLLMCNKRRSLSDIRREFPHFDCSLIDHDEDVVWDEHRARNMGYGGTPARESDVQMSSRAYKFLEDFVAARKEKEIVVVGHSALFLSMTNTVFDVTHDQDLITPMFAQAEIRSIELVFEEQ